MTEPVRLVIWDLDETFWTGTVTEGGHQYQKAAHDMVIELARRGIMSSICSKNDSATIRAILEAEGIWDYFIFPSIDWSPKGPRVAAIIEAVQLRPATVMFIDDNPMNLNEAKHITPDLQIGDEKVIPTLLDNPLFKGKDDSGLTRLAQYKLLEKRATDQVASGGDNTEFLRASNIRVVVEHDVEKHIDRAIELINRTNQLNFTKDRLPEDHASAKLKLRALLKDWSMQIGLVRVIDNYGDYGFCGFYTFDKVKMRHFCFSCRILGMGVEQWLYARLGKPPIKIVGEVLTDLKAECDIDWIRYARDDEQANAQEQKKRLGNVFIRGGCDLTSVGHYLTLMSESVVLEQNFVHNNLSLRLDHSIFTRYAIDGLSPMAYSALRNVGYDVEKFQSSLLESVANSDVFIFSFWTDANFSLYTHGETGVQVPFQVGSMNHRINDITKLETIELEKYKFTPYRRRVIDYLCKTYKFSGPISKERYLDNLSAIVDLIGLDRPIILTCGFEGRPPHKYLPHIELNGWTREFASRHHNVLILDVADAIKERSDVVDFLHFDRKVYQRMAEKVVQLTESFEHEREIVQRPEHLLIS